MEVEVGSCVEIPSGTFCTALIAAAPLREVPPGIMRSYSEHLGVSKLILFTSRLEIYRSLEDPEIRGNLT